MEKKMNPLKNSRILYLAIVAVLCVTAIVIGIVAATNRATTPPDNGTTPPGNTETPPPEEEKNPPAEEKPTGTAVEYLCPVSGLVARKHSEDDFIYSNTMADWRVHTGMDIATEMGETVSASAAGKVKEVWEDPLMGTCLSLDHGNGVVTVYMNLAPELPPSMVAGAEVKAGEAIGIVGESAMVELADEPHLHFEVSVNGALVDPLTVLSEKSISASLTFDGEIVEE